MIIRADSISRAFNAKEVLRSATLQINEGDRVGLVGRNGAGKTTLLKILMGELKPDTGEISIRAKKMCYLSQFAQEGGPDKVEDLLNSTSTSTQQDKRMVELERMMVDGPESGGMDWDSLMEEYNSLHEEMAKSNSKGVGANTKDALVSVGLEHMTEGLMSEMSGGERTKARIAQILMQAGDADLIILDEPTSHLDIDTVEWLEEYLMNIGSGLLIVSHDRYFMDRVANQIVELENGVTNQYSGNYTQFVEKKELEYERLKIAAEKYSTEKDRLEKMAEQQHAKLWYKATHKVTLKRIDRMEKIDPPREERDIKMRIESASRGGREAIRAKNLTVELGGRKIINGLDLDVEVGDKIGIIGPNGCGKTTLIRAVMGEIEHSGELWVAPGAKIGYFAQGHDHLNPDISAEQQLLLDLGPDEKLKARSLLARQMITGYDGSRPIRTLSGVERAKVALASLIAERRNLLVLDEPTNYLDIPSKNAVESALADYTGTMVVVTHDRYFLDAVCNKICEMREGKAKVFPGTYTEMKGSKTYNEVTVEEAGFYKVVSSFTEWTSKRTFKPGDKVSIAPSEMPLFKWAFDNGKLKKVQGTEKKKVQL